jgi:hypothetical protein
MALSAVLAAAIIVFSLSGQETLAVYVISIATIILVLATILAYLNHRSVVIMNVMSAFILVAFLVYMAIRVAAIVG